MDTDNEKPSPKFGGFINFLHWAEQKCLFFDPIGMPLDLFKPFKISFPGAKLPKEPSAGFPIQVHVTEIIPGSAFVKPDMEDWGVRFEMELAQIYEEEWVERNLASLVLQSLA